MLLLIIDDESAFAKKEAYSQRLPVRGILHANTLGEAQKMILKEDDVDFLLIRNVLIENVAYQLEELKKLSRSFSGAIILKVDNEEIGFSLMKKSIISEYYLSDEDKDVEFENLKKAFKFASLKRRISKNLCQVNQDFQKIHEFKIK